MNEQGIMVDLPQGGHEDVDGHGLLEELLVLEVLRQSVGAEELGGGLQEI